MTATAITSGTNHADTWSASRWIGARLRCACATMRTICASMVSRPIFWARMRKLPDWFIVPPDDAGAGFLGGRHRFTGNHRLIERAAPLEDLPVDGYGFTRTHAQQVANDHGLQGHILLAAIGAPAPRTLRRQVQQCLDCAAGLLSGFEFEHLPQEHQ